MLDRLIILLGPYRNLTTLTAATLAMHPRIQVLNHAMVRLHKDPGLNIFDRPGDTTLDRFLSAGYALSEAGERGQQGGSILHSHAFDDAGVRERYAARFGDVVLKPDATHLVWKESMRVQNRLAGEAGLVDRLCALGRIRFMLPIRDPLSCAQSNLRKHYPHLGLKEGASIEAAVEAVLAAHHWTLTQADRHPDRFCVFTERDPRPAVFERWARTGGFDASSGWLADAGQIFAPRATVYDHDEDLIAWARERTRVVLGAWPDVLRRLGIEG